MLQPSEEIKSKLDIVEVIREYVPLKAAGFNFRALCPFHREKTPSFMVSPEKQIWHCFGCSKGGDIFSFIMEIEGLGFAEVLHLLAKKAGVTLHRSDPALTSQRNRLLDIVELSSKYYHKVLLDSPQAEKIRAYLTRRGLTEETILNWRIGYSPDSWDSLFNFLKSKGFKENEIFLSGMIVKKERTPGFYDRFRGRIMFPLNDINGNTVGFSARMSPEKEEEEKMGKYINTPQTMIYDKSRILFGLDKAKMAIKKEDLAILVEGQMDTITAQQNGFTNVIATSGTALTSDQVSLIKRYSNNLYLAFDMDKAGDLASERGIAQAMQAEMNIKVIILPLGKDPDECIKKDPELWRQAVKTAKPMMQYYFNKTFSKLDIKQSEGQRKAVKILLPVIAKLGNFIERDFWLKKLSQALDTSEYSLRELLSKIVLHKLKVSRNESEVKAEKKEVFYSKPTREEMLTELLLALILKYPLHIDYVINHIGQGHLVGKINQLIYKSLILYYNNIIDLGLKEKNGEELAIPYQDFKDWMGHAENTIQNEEANNINNQLKALDRLMFLADKDFNEYSQEQARSEIINIITVLKKNYLNFRLKEIAKFIAEEETSEPDNNEKLATLMEEFKTLADELNQIERDS